MRKNQILQQNNFDQMLLLSQNAQFEQKLKRVSFLKTIYLEKDEICVLST